MNEEVGDYQAEEHIKEEEERTVRKMGVNSE